ncbi:Uncharacterised protein [Shimwellia blattae]|nr:Uncharacterised protein [Shimwellia blattae]
MGAGVSLQRGESVSGVSGHRDNGGTSKISQLPAVSVPLMAARASASTLLRASKTPWWNSRPSRLRSWRGGQPVPTRGCGPTHKHSVPRAVDSCPARARLHSASPLMTSKRRYPLCAMFCAMAHRVDTMVRSSMIVTNYSWPPKVSHCLISPVSKPRLNQV